jgi:formylglycine-generating enzyme required for sulfatase activity
MMDLEWVALDGYRISKNLITQGQYKSVMGKNPSKGEKKDTLPIEGVTWFNATAFCESLSVSLPTEIEWKNAASQDTIKRNDFYWEWTSSCDGLICLRKGLVNSIDSSYTTDPYSEDIGGGYISFRVVKRD